MNQTTRLLAPATLVLGAHCTKVHLQAILHRHFNIISKASLQSPKSSLETCQKYSLMENSDLTNECKIDLASENECLNYALQKMHVNDIVDENVNNLDLHFNSELRGSMKRRYSPGINKYKELRKWLNVDNKNITVNLENDFVFKLLSYNILAQELLEAHAYLYREHNKWALPWEKRKPLITREILESNAHVVCIQEMQEEHLMEFLVPFQENKFAHLYKKRTNDKNDGLLILYREDRFSLLEVAKVELYQTGIELLSRDNVGLVAKFSLKESPSTKFVVATTHLLFNPRRNDVRLGQVQLLFAEIERIAFIKNTPLGPTYLPIILSGDFNLEPYSGVYRFITEGSIEFIGKGRNLEKCDYRCLSNSLIPPHLYVTDECQHFNVLSQRLSGKGSGKVMLRNTENGDTVNVENSGKSNLIDSNTNNYQKVEVAAGHYVTFSSGLLTHPFQLQSVYHHIDQNGNGEATTFQNKWITVDYIFYSSVEPLEVYRLPTINECEAYLRTIPNSIVGSDHLCIGATFKLRKR